MKLSEYAAQHANDGKKIEAKTYVSATTSRAKHSERR